MPIIYGEGESSAFYRLQIEIFESTGDISMLAWDGACLADEGDLWGYYYRPTLFAPSLDAFCTAISGSPPRGNGIPQMLPSYHKTWSKIQRQPENVRGISTYTAGLRLQLALVPVDQEGEITSEEPDFHIALLPVQLSGQPMGPLQNPVSCIGILFSTPSWKFGRVHRSLNASLTNFGAPNPTTDIWTISAEILSTYIEKATLTEIFLPTKVPALRKRRYASFDAFKECTVRLQLPDDLRGDLDNTLSTEGVLLGFGSNYNITAWDPTNGDGLLINFTTPIDRNKRQLVVFELQCISRSRSARPGKTAAPEFTSDSDTENEENFNARARLFGDRGEAWMLKLRQSGRLLLVNLNCEVKKEKGIQIDVDIGFLE